MFIVYASAKQMAEAGTLPWKGGFGMVVTTLDGWEAGNGITIGTEVFCADGAHLGSVVDGDAYDLVVEQGWFLVRDYQIHLSDVAAVDDGKLVLSLSKEDVEQRRVR